MVGIEDRKVRVLFVIDTLEIGGAERSVVDIATALGSGQAEVVTLYAGSHVLADNLISSGVAVHRLNLRGKYQLFSATRALIRLARSQRSEVLHCTLFRSSLAARFAGALLAIPVVSSLVSVPYAQERKQRLRTRAARFKHYLVHAADLMTSRWVSCYIANSKSVAHQNIKALRLPPTRVEVVYRGRDVNRFSPASDSESVTVRCGLGAGPDDLIVASVGRLVASKRVDMLIECIRDLHDPRLLLVVCGDGPERQRLQALAGGLRVRFLGHQDDVVPILRASQWFASASEFEGLPGAAIEAMLCALPCVLSDIPMHRELDTADGDVVWFPADEMAACSDAISAALSMPPSAARQLGQKLRENAALKFNNSVMIDGHRRVYMRLAGRQDATG